MGSEDVLVEIHPRELRFLVEVKKQSSCCIHLVNKSDQYVAFKVKTTSPKKYCVRPNIGVILPLASRDFTGKRCLATGEIGALAYSEFIAVVQVTMQALNNAPLDLQTKDKFLVETTVVPFGTADEGIVPAFEKKLKVVTVSITEPQVEQLINGVPHAKETAGVSVTEQTLDNVNEAPNVVNEVCNSLKASFPSLSGTATFNENSSLVNECHTILQDFLVPPKQASFTLSESASNLQETSVASIETKFSSTEASVDLKESPPPEYTPAPSEVPSLSDKESTNADNVHIPQVTKDVQNLQMKLNNLEIKLEEASTLIVKLREANTTTIQERDKLRKEMVFLKRAGAARSQSSTGFPLLFVIYMAVVGISLGCLLPL